MTQTITAPAFAVDRSAGFADAGTHTWPAEPVLVPGGPHGITARTGGTGRASRTSRGMVSAEWAVGIIAAIAIAGVLLAVVTSGPVQDALLGFILSVIQLFSSGFKN